MNNVSEPGLDPIAYVCPDPRSMSGALEGGLGFFTGSRSITGMLWNMGGVVQNDSNIKLFNKEYEECKVMRTIA